MTTQIQTRFARIAFVVLGLSACAPTTSYEETSPDASPKPEQPSPPQQPPPPQPAPPDAGPVTPPGDACVPTVTQLLINPAFDMAPQGAGWQETLVDPDFRLITGEDGVAEHSPARKAWLGGYEANTGTVTDRLVQEVTVPPLTTALVLTGFHDVRTAEPQSTIAYDTAELAIIKPDGTLVTKVLSLSNLTPRTTWTMFGHAFTENLSGQTVRIKLTSTNDTIDATSFFFDSMALTATHGCTPVM